MYINRTTGEQVKAIVNPVTKKYTIVKEGCVIDYLSDKDFQEQYESVMYICPNKECDGLDCGERHKKPHIRENCCDDITTTCKASCIPVEKEPHKNFLSGAGAVIIKGLINSTPNVYISYTMAQMIHNWYSYYYASDGIGDLEESPIVQEFIKQIESIIDKE
jgi:hypothetical protein